LRDFQSVGFKAREVAAQPEIVRVTLETLWNEGFAAGLSSLGPAVFVVSENETPEIGPLLDSGMDMWGPYSFRNEGHDEHRL
jgi:predicted sugar kinase